ncbi:MAG: hypothetical protein WCC87_25225 [Candidatus Korobacteraceae bacterium]
MRPHRYNKKAAPTRAVAQTAETDPSAVERGSARDVDSRAYAFAYLATDPSQLPADFPVDEGFERALFLPKEIVPRFETPRYVPRLLLEGQDRVTVYSHPRCGAGKTTIRFADISHIELERFLADCSLIIFTPGRTVHLPFHGRDREYVVTFLERLKRRLLSGGPQLNSTAQQQDFGPRPDYKFQQIEAMLNLDQASVVARFFVPPKEVIKSRLFRNELSWTFGSAIVATRTELHIFSDDNDGYRQLYGFRASWAPLQKITDIKWESALESITIRLLGDLSLRVPVPEELRSEAEEFADFASRQILNRRTT